ncbi:MAG: TIGR00295 family protein [Candidatus Helarchaeota archaeon]
MNNKIPTREEVFKAFEEVKLGKNVIKHVVQVCKKAVEIAKKIKNNGHTVDIKLVEIGALLHDIGRSETNKIDHAIKSAEIIKKYGWSDKLGRIAETHLLGGVDKYFAQILGLPAKDYLPETLEEKIVCYADKIIKGSKEVSVDERFKYWKKRFGNTLLLDKSEMNIKKIEAELKKLMSK